MPLEIKVFVVTNQPIRDAEGAKVVAAFLDRQYAADFVRDLQRKNKEAREKDPGMAEQKLEITEVPLQQPRLVPKKTGSPKVSA